MVEYAAVNCGAAGPRSVRGSKIKEKAVRTTNANSFFCRRKVSGNVNCEYAVYLSVFTCFTGVILFGGSWKKGIYFVGSQLNVLCDRFFEICTSVLRSNSADNQYRKVYEQYCRHVEKETAFCIGDFSEYRLIGVL